MRRYNELYQQTEGRQGGGVSVYLRTHQKLIGLQVSSGDSKPQQQQASLSLHLPIVVVERHAREC